MAVKVGQKSKVAAHPHILKLLLLDFGRGQAVWSAPLVNFVSRRESGRRVPCGHKYYVGELFQKDWLVLGLSLAIPNLAFFVGSSGPNLVVN